MIKNYFSNIFKARYILSNLVRQDLKNRYRSSILGLAWTFLTPLGLVGIIGLVYSVVFSTPMEQFVPYLFSGLIPWLFLNQCADGGTTSFLAGQGYIKQTQTPLEIFPIRVAMGAFINLLISLVAFFLVFSIIQPGKMNLNTLLVIPALAIWFCFGVAWATLVAFAHVLVRDFGPLQALVLQGLFYVTPIIYPLETIKGKGLDWVLYINPLYYFFDILRQPLLGELPTIKYAYIICIGVVLVLLLISILLMKNIGRKITYRL